MTKKKIISLMLVQLLGIVLSASKENSLSLIRNLKKYALQEWGGNIAPDLFTEWRTENKPLVYLFVSQSDTIADALHVGRYFTFFDTAGFAAGKKATLYKNEGYDTFCYRTYGNAQAFLFKRLLDYQEEALTFVVFHELMHNFCLRQDIRVPYEFEEALCDVAANYGTLEFARQSHAIDTMAAHRQVLANETVYTIFNHAIAQINSGKDSPGVQHAACRHMLDSVLRSCNLFQRDRFDYPVNNAYLLKNRNYSHYYFLIKKVYMKLKSVRLLLSFMRTLPDDRKQCEELLRKAG